MCIQYALKPNEKNEIKIAFDYKLPYSIPGKTIDKLLVHRQDVKETEKSL